MKTLLTLLLAIAFPAIAAPVYIATDGNVVITLTDEKCTLPIKLPYRATWVEKGKVSEGCFGVDRGVVVFYWSDTSLGLIPTSEFKPAKAV